MDVRKKEYQIPDRSNKKGPNHQESGPPKPNNAKDTNSELWRSHRSRVKQDQGDTRKSTRAPMWDKDQTNASTDTSSASPQDHSDAVPTSAHTQQTALKRRNQILSDIKKYESMSFQEGSTGASLKAEAVAKLRTELEQVQ